MRHKKLRKSSYISLKRVLKVNRTILERYSRREPADQYRLDDASFKLVLRELTVRGLVEIATPRARQHIYPLRSYSERPHLGTQPSLITQPSSRKTGLSYSECLQAQSAARSAQVFADSRRQYGTLPSRQHQQPARDYLLERPALYRPLPQQGVMSHQSGGAPPSDERTGMAKAICILGAVAIFAAGCALYRRSRS